MKRAEDAKSKKELEEAQAAAREKQKVMKEKKIRANLKVAIKIRKRPALKKSTTDFKKAKLQDHDGDLPKAERLLKLAEVKDSELTDIYEYHVYACRAPTSYLLLVIQN